MEALGLIAALAFIIGKGLLMGVLVYVPFWLVGRLFTKAGKTLQEKAHRESIPR